MAKFKIGDKALRANRSLEPMRWVPFVINETYLRLTLKYPEDFMPLPVAKKIRKGKYMYGKFVVERSTTEKVWLGKNSSGQLIQAPTFEEVKHKINVLLGESVPPIPETGPPMGDYRWVLSGKTWVLSYVTDAGTLVVPKPNFDGTNEVLALIHQVAKLHDLDPKRISGIKTWDKFIAVHF